MYEEPVEVLPLTLHELYKQNSTNPPCGVLLYVPPGIKKNILVKVVANHTIMAFITIIDLEFVQKYLGEVCLNSYFYSSIYFRSHVLMFV